LATLEFAQSLPPILDARAVCQEQLFCASRGEPLAGRGYFSAREATALLFVHSKVGYSLLWNRGMYCIVKYPLI